MKRLRHVLMHCIRMPWADRWIAFQAVLWLAFARLALRFRPLPALQAAVPLQQKARPDSVEDVRHVCGLVNRVSARIAGQGDCLPRSLAALWLLRRRGTDSELRIGVAKHGSTLEAHAWLEFGGEPVNDAPEVAARFAVLAARGEPSQ